MINTGTLTALAEAMAQLYQGDEVARDSIYQGYEVRFDDPLGAVDLYEAALERGNHGADPSDRDLWVAGTHAADGSDLVALIEAYPLAK